MDIREAIAEADGLVRACSGLGDHRELRLMAASASDETVISLGAIRALHALAATMTGTSAISELVALVRASLGDGQRELQCAPDVCRALPRSPLEGYRNVSPDIPASMALGIRVTMMDHYEPGRWRLIRHDRCDVIGGFDLGQAVMITHEHCTVLREGRTTAGDGDVK